jgi:hypothetical protein
MEIFNNPLVKSIALKQLKKLMKESNLESIVIKLDDSGEPDFLLFTQDIVKENQELKLTIANFLKN